MKKKVKTIKVSPKFEDFLRKLNYVLLVIVMFMLVVLFSAGVKVINGYFSKG